VELVALAVLKWRMTRAKELLAAFDRGADEIVTTLILEHVSARRSYGARVALRIKNRLAYERTTAQT
jgi:hypothetical protein